MTKLEEVARALAFQCGLDRQYSDEDLLRMDADRRTIEATRAARIPNAKEYADEAWPRYVLQARAAIEALREPSEAMLRAAYDPNGPTIWRDMIDAALAEKPEQQIDVGARIIGGSRVP